MVVDSAWLGSNATDKGRIRFWERPAFQALTVPSACVKARQVRKSWKNAIFFHVLAPILQAFGWGTLRGVLLSRGIPRGCGAHHTTHEEEVGRKVMQDAPGWMGEEEGR